MKIKSYFAGTVETAMLLARQELGPEAMLVHSKRATGEARKLGEYEVVFASEADSPNERTTSPAPIEDVALNRLADDIGVMRRQIERMAAALGSAPVFRDSAALVSPEAADWFATLIRAGIAPETARKFALEASSSDTRTGEILERIVRNSLQTDSWQDLSPARRRVAAFIGPPGGGKTTTLTKVAAVFGLGRRITTQVLTCDVRRIAAAEPLRTLCSILGVGFQAVETPSALAQALTQHAEKSLILIDTPGTNRNGGADIGGFPSFFASRPDIEKHLVLPASMKQEDQSRIADEHSIWAYTHLIFSKLDETSTFGCILNETLRTGRPVSFLSGGQELPEDLEVAEPGRLADIVLGSEYAIAQESRAAA